MTPVSPSLNLEHEILREYSTIIALDEVGRGALAGPVAVGAAVMDAERSRLTMPEGLRDSKLVPEKKRADLARRAAEWVPVNAVGWASAGEVDALGIIRALGLAASRAITAVCVAPIDLSSALVVLDGNHDYVSSAHHQRITVRSVIKGDRDCASVSAASVIAKVARDTHMAQLHAEFPQYHWERNKGYASATHREAIRQLGLSPHHRASWAIADAPALF